jgi:hypothetical protein
VDQTHCYSNPGEKREERRGEGKREKRREERRGVGNREKKRSEKRKVKSAGALMLISVIGVIHVEQDY